MKPNRYILIAASILALGGILYYFLDIVSYVLIAWVISILGRPLMIFFMKRLKIGRIHAGPSVCALLTLLCFFLGFLLLFSLFVPLIVEQATNLSNVDYDAVSKSLEEPFAEINQLAHRFGMISEGQTATEQLHSMLTNWFEPSKISDFFSSFISIAGSVLIGIMSVVFIAFFFLKDSKMFSEFLMTLVPQRFEKQSRLALVDVTKLLTRYFSGILIQVVFVAIFITTGLMILGVPNALLIGLFASLINMVPYLGPLLGGTFAVLVTVSSNLQLDFHSQMVPMILKVVALFASMQFINDFFVQPTIFSNRVHAHPLEIFLVIMIAAKVGGIGGMVIAIPTYTALRVIARTFLSQFRLVQKLTEGMKAEEDQS